VAQEQIPPSEAPGAVRTLEWFFLCVGALMALEVLQARKRATAGGADVGPRLVCFRGRNVAIGTRLTIQVGLLL
jgi:hypothetical protein